MANSVPYTADGLPFHSTAPRVWHGMTLPVWLRLLARGRFRVSPDRIPMCLSITAASAVNSGLALWEEAVNGRRVRRARLQPPLLIVGHWRTGTTLLHELMVLDEQFSFPTTLQTMAPHHFLSSAWIVRPLLQLMLPKRRPMDAMAMGADLPQEDEFAICNLGLDSCYLHWAWPNDRHLERLLEFDALDSPAGRRWQEKFLRFLQRLAADDPRRIVLKSPTHTARLRLFDALFPQSQFVHLVRDPLDVIPSMIRTFQRLHFMQGLQAPRFEELEDGMFWLFRRMHELEQRDRAALGPDRYVDVRYEDLVAEPIATMEGVYQQLGLEGFERLKPKLRAYFERQKDYRTNRHKLAPALKARIEVECRDYAERFGYAAPSDFQATRLEESSGSPTSRGG